MINLTEKEFKELYDLLDKRPEGNCISNYLEKAKQRGWIVKTKLEEFEDEYKYLKADFGDKRIDHLYNLALAVIEEQKGGK